MGRIPRTKLRANLCAGKSAKLDVVVQMPENRGSYILEWDLVKESVAWFSNKAFATLRVTVMVE